MSGCSSSCGSGYGGAGGGGGGGGGEDLAQTLVIGNFTGGTDILVSTGDEIVGESDLSLRSTGGSSEIFLTSGISGFVVVDDFLTLSSTAVVSATAPNVANIGTRLMNPNPNNRATGLLLSTASTPAAGSGVSAKTAGYIHLLPGDGGASSPGAGNLSGIGGVIDLIAGRGGAATASEHSASGGGAIRVFAGPGGAGAAGVFSGNGGSLQLAAGAAGSAGGGTRGNGGVVTLNGGAGRTGGTVAIAAGNGSELGGGNLTLSAGTGVTAGGAITATAGTGGSTGPGGAATFVAGSGVPGGNAELRGGDGLGASPNQGGSTLLRGGNGTNAGSVDIAGGLGQNGGSVFIVGGTSTVGGGSSLNLTGGQGATFGGNVFVTGGLGTINGGGSVFVSTAVTTTQNSGSVQLTTGSSTSGITGSIVIRPGASASGPVAGSVQIVGGERPGGFAGSVTIAGGDGATRGTVRLGTLSTSNVLVGDNTQPDATPLFEVFPPVSLKGQTAVPSTDAAGGKVYSRDAAGVFQLFYLDSAGTEYQITPPAGGPPVLTTTFTLAAGQASAIGQVFTLTNNGSAARLIESSNQNIVDSYRPVAVATQVLAAGGTGDFETVSGRVIPVLFSVAPAASSIGARVYLGDFGEATLTAPNTPGFAVVQLGYLVSAPGGTLADVLWQPQILAVLI
jgi:hypothetical protein